MRPRIEDEFTKLPISRQRKYQLRMQRDKRCTECGAQAMEGSRCLEHLVNRIYEPEALGDTPSLGLLPGREGTPPGAIAGTLSERLAQ